jgi:hypothetical protein
MFVLTYIQIKSNFSLKNGSFQSKKSFILIKYQILDSFMSHILLIMAFLWHNSCILKFGEISVSINYNINYKNLKKFRLISFMYQISRQVDLWEY